MRSGLLLAATAGGNWLDPIIIGIILLSVALGILRGLIRSVAGFIGLVLAALFAGRFATLLDPALDRARIQHPPIAGAVAFVLAFVIIFVAVEMAANLLRFVQRLLFLGWIDRVGGAVFGLVRGMLLSMVLLAILALFGSSQFNGYLRQAQVAVTLWQDVPSLAAMLPPGIRERAIDQITGGNLP